MEERTNSASWVSRWPSSWLRSPKFVIARLMFWRRFARAPLMLGQVAREGLEALQARRQLAAVVARRPWPAAWSRSWRKERVSPSSEAKIWSGWTFGCELASGSVEPSWTVSAARCPGRPRSSCPGAPCAGAAEARRPGGSGPRTCGRSAWSRWRGRSRAPTPDTWPTLIPAMVTVCPCPGVTAWAELNSALSSNLSSPMSGIQDGSRVVC